MESKVFMSATTAAIFPAMVRMQSSLGAAHKVSDNPFFSSKYADLTEVLETIRGPMSENGLAITQLPGHEDGKVTVTTMIVHESGEYFGCVAGVTPEKAGPQPYGSIVTYLRRYSAAAATGLTQKDDDGETATNHNAKPHEIVIGFGKYQGYPLGEVAQMDLGYVRWLASKQGDLQGAAQAVFDAHHEELTSEQISDQLQDATTYEDCVSLWRLLNSEQQTEWKQAFSDRKADFEQPTRNAETARA